MQTLSEEVWRAGVIPDPGWDTNTASGNAWRKEEVKLNTFTIVVIKEPMGMDDWEMCSSASLGNVAREKDQEPEIICWDLKSSLLEW